MYRHTLKKRQRCYENLSNSTVAIVATVGWEFSTYILGNACSLFQWARCYKRSADIASPPSCESDHSETAGKETWNRRAGTLNHLSP